jgi:hypothetical protein
MMRLWAIGFFTFAFAFVFAFAFALGALRDDETPREEMTDEGTNPGNGPLIFPSYVRTNKSSAQCEASARQMKKDTRIAK